LTIEHVVCNRAALPSVRWQSSSARPGLEGLCTHQSLNSMKTATISKLQHIVPNTPSTIGPVTGHKALKYFGSQHFVSQTTLTPGSAQPRIEAASRHTDRLAQSLNWPRASVFCNEIELHIDSFAKYAAAFFKMSRSILSLATSRCKRAISACSGFIWPSPGNASWGSWSNLNSLKGLWP
jgi:hypothetical protein